MENMTTPGVFSWVRPAELFKTQGHPRYHSVLDFVFIAHKPADWTVDSKILRQGFPYPDDTQRSDHRPVQARILISP
jgi:hypothetical protein